MSGLSLELANVRLSYRQPGGGRIDVLSVPELRLRPGATLGVTGPSGSGKTTLLAVLSGLERPPEGMVRWGDCDITSLAEAKRDRWRRTSVGIVFQDFQLLPAMSALGNVLLASAFSHVRVPARLRARAHDLLAQVGLTAHRGAVGSMARGEMQRVAIARALLFEPPVLLADEPTASLDPDNAAAVADLLLGLARVRGSTLVVVSHDRAILKGLDRVATMVAGQLLEADA
jgi:putative ABC transport system ATP-binding protein